MLNLGETAGEMGTAASLALAAVSAWLPGLVSAIAVLCIGYLAAVWAARGANRLLGRAGRLEPTLVPVITATVRYTIMIVISVAALSQLGVQTTSLLAALGAAGLAIGLALQGTLQNIAAGIMILWLRPFRIGEYVDNGSIAGTVREVGLFATTIDTYDGIFRFVPNADLWNAPITNFSRNPTRMTDMAIGIGYGSNIKRARDILLELAAADKRVRRIPEPIVFVDDLGDSAVVLRYRVWIGTNDFWATQRALLEEAKRRFDAEGIEIPFPQRVVHMAAGANPEEPAAQAA